MSGAGELEPFMLQDTRCRKNLEPCSRTSREEQQKHKLQSQGRDSRGGLLRALDARAVTVATLARHRREQAHPAVSSEVRQCVLVSDNLARLAILSPRCVRSKLVSVVGELDQFANPDPAVIDFLAHVVADDHYHKHKARNGVAAFWRKQNQHPFNNQVVADLEGAHVLLGLQVQNGGIQFLGIVYTETGPAKQLPARAPGGVSMMEGSEAQTAVGYLAGRLLVQQESRRG